MSMCVQGPYWTANPITLQEHTKNDRGLGKPWFAGRGHVVFVKRVNSELEQIL